MSLPIFFLGKEPEYFAPLAQCLKERGFIVIRSSISDEIDQAGKQMKKAVLVFSNFKFAVEFLSSHAKDWGGFETVKALYLPGTPKLTAEVQSKLNQMELKIFNAKKMSEFVEKIENFNHKSSLQLAEDGDEMEIELEFSASASKENK